MPTPIRRAELEYLKKQFRREGMTDLAFLNYYNRENKSEFILTDELICSEKIVAAARENPNGLKTLIDRLTQESPEKAELLLKTYMKGVKVSCTPILEKHEKPSWFKTRLGLSK